MRGAHLLLALAIGEALPLATILGASFYALSDRRKRFQPKGR